MAEEFKSITTQEEFDSRIRERLERAEKSARKAFDGWTSPDDLKAINAKHEQAIADLNAKHAEEMKKYDGYGEKFAALENENKSLKVSALKTKIANEKNLSLDAVEFLNGEDEETITASADKLAKLSNASRTFGFTRNTETNAGDSKDDIYRELARKFGKQ